MYIKVHIGRDAICCKFRWYKNTNMYINRYVSDNDEMALNSVNRMTESTCNKFLFQAYWGIYANAIFN